MLGMCQAMKFDEGAETWGILESTVRRVKGVSSISPLESYLDKIGKRGLVKEILFLEYMATQKPKVCESCSKIPTNLSTLIGGRVGANEAKSSACNAEPRN